MLQNNNEYNLSFCFRRNLKQKYLPLYSALITDSYVIIKDLILIEWFRELLYSRIFSATYTDAIEIFNRYDVAQKGKPWLKVMMSCGIFCRGYN